MKKYKIITAVSVAAVLIFSFWYGGNSPKLHGFDIQTEKTENINKTEESENIVSNDEKKEITPELPKINVNNTNDEPIEETRTEDKKEQAAEKTVTAITPEPQIPIEKTEGNFCTLSVRCNTILNNITYLKEEKRKIVPEDGVILNECRAEFYDGETVFNVLVREMKKNKIHMEFVNTPIYNSAYIEGIANIYEFDCGELSGWMYSVNGVFPNYGCSQYTLKNGDNIEWVYTCDLGNDVGGGYSARNGN